MNDTPKLVPPRVPICPCRFCGSSDLNACFPGDPGSPHAMFAWVFCSTCMAIGPQKPTLDEAIDAWDAERPPDAVISLAQQDEIRFSFDPTGRWQVLGIEPEDRTTEAEPYPHSRCI